MTTRTAVSESVAFIKEALNCSSKRPLIVGYSGPQGSGKTFNCHQIAKELNQQQVNVIQFSMDDFYLKHQDQLKVQDANKDDVLLQGRGLPGTHDLKLLFNVIDQLKNPTENESVKLPQYDKSKFNGQGDRLDPWVEIDAGNLDVILFEGWFNGYVYIPDDNQLLDKWCLIKTYEKSKFKSIQDKHIIKLNTNLKEYFHLWELFDEFICVKTRDLNIVYKWRTQQEHELIQKKGVGMSDEDVVKFVDRYMPMYELYYDRLELMINMKPSLTLVIDETRQLIN